jgi:hypothetical protein
MNYGHVENSMKGRGWIPDDECREWQSRRSKISAGRWRRWLITDESEGKIFAQIAGARAWRDPSILSG